MSRFAWGKRGKAILKRFGTCCEYVRPSNEFEKRCTPKLNPVETYEEHGSLVALYLPTTTLTWYSNEDMDMVTEKGNLTGLFQRERPMHRDASVENATRNDTLGPSSFSAPLLTFRYWKQIVIYSREGWNIFKKIEFRWRIRNIITCSHIRIYIW